jgi:serine kinase of HPr protein (carbohydrate metabolism regulator)
MTTESVSIHATCVLAGAQGVLIRGPSGSGKSRLALEILQAAECGALPFARLVSDDRTRVENIHGRLLGRAAPSISGMLELRHLGIRQMQIEPIAVIRLVLDAVPDAERLPDARARTTVLAGVNLPRLALPSFSGALPVVLNELAELGRRSAGK